MKSIVIVFVILYASSLMFAEGSCSSCSQMHNNTINAKQVASVEQKGGGANENHSAATVTLPGYGKKVALDKNTYFTYEFTKKPKMGANTLKVNIMDKQKKAVKSYQVFVSYDMPSMKGMHAVNDQPMQINKAGNYLLPLNFVMPGIWQVDLKFMQGKSVISKGSFTLKI
ncbi:MAG TPA: FixH family protein [Candidatus Cloacimonadota bacterium]|nr:FixH family protein [Candidatus Cloacimonadota bacterium]